MNTVRSLADMHRRHPGRLLLLAAAVFVPLMPLRLLLVDARAFVPALALTVVGHLVLAAILYRRREQLGLRPLLGGAPVLVVGLVLITGAQILLGQGVEAVVGMSAFGVTLGGTLPSILLGPAWAGLLAGIVAARSAPRPST